MHFCRKTIANGVQLIIILAFLLSGCAAAAPSAGSPSSPPAAPSTPAPTLPPTPQKSKPSLYLPPYFPAALREAVKLPADWSTAETAAGGALSLRVGGESGVVSRWVYAAVVPFPTPDDSLSAGAIRAAWQGRKTPEFFPTSILIDADTQRVFTDLWGQADASLVKTVDADKLIDSAWAAKSALTLIPFEQLQPRWKVLEIDGQNPLHKSFDEAKYALTVPFSLMGQGASTPAPSGVFPATNRNPAKLTTIVLTGVTALVRGTADLMERNGMDYPAQDIGDLLREADITHVNNEIPFTHSCPPPFMREDNLVFCSKPEYIKLLDDIGADVIELAGDHFQDWGPQAVLESIDLYKQHGMKYYGGGLNLADGRKALQMTVNGNKIAFIGCNAKAIGYAGARENQPGAVHCDFDWLRQEIGRVKAEGYLPIATFQHLEYYSYLPHPILQADFEAVASDGAVIASGSQAHQPQAMEFFNGSFLHFGLGNLFFDQYKEGIPERQAFIDRHVIYDNRYINTELITIQFVDLARARFMTPEERRALLQTVFSASGW